MYLPADAAALINLDIVAALTYVVAYFTAVGSPATAPVSSPAASNSAAPSQRTGPVQVGPAPAACAVAPVTDCRELTMEHHDGPTFLLEQIQLYISLLVDVSDCNRLWVQTPPSPSPPPAAAPVAAAEGSTTGSAQGAPTGPAPASPAPQAGSGGGTVPETSPMPRVRYCRISPSEYSEVSCSELTQNFVRLHQIGSLDVLHFSDMTQRSCQQT